jgi:AGZA family xanthine/uracil permease-like MFS transporter
VAEQTASTGRGGAPGGHGGGGGGLLDRFFQVSERGSTYGRETRGGLATFFTMA